ncbi:S-adenosyl-L-methionine-dependent methyltransferase [Biscogniauxia sp. FL1348]|nr:S-adenosyl-L-methionine-dependent methyltransferase [Biscogniauxia sp. FL1348]
MTSSSDSPADLNRAYFDEQAATYDSKHAKLIDRLTREIQNRLDFIGVDWADDDDDEDKSEEEEDKKPKREVRLLDYACGTGLVSRALAPYVTQCVGIDISANMVAAYNARAQNQGLSPSEMHAIQGDLLSPSSPSLSSSLSSLTEPFHIAAVGAGFHHFADPGLAARRLAERLCPGGVLLVIDFLDSRTGNHGEEEEVEEEVEVGHHGDDQGGAHTVMHHRGFTEAQVRDMFEAAGAGGGFALEVVGRGFVGRKGEDDAWVGVGEGEGDGEEGGEERGEERDDDGRRKGKKNSRGRKTVLFMARGTKV